MDKLEKYRILIKDIVCESAKFPPSHGQIEVLTIFDDERQSYQLMFVGWDGPRRVHSSVIHIRLHHNKIWIEWDGTEESVAGMLVAAGVPKDEIVLAFYPEENRLYTGYAQN